MFFIICDMYVFCLVWTFFFEAYAKLSIKQHREKLVANDKTKRK